jgi:hypothetical protein
MAGVTTLATPDQVTYIGNGIAVCHGVNLSPVTVRFGEPVDPDGRTVLARGVREWVPECRLLETDLVFSRPAARMETAAK